MAAYLGVAVLVLLVGTGAILSRRTLHSSGSDVGCSHCSTSRSGAAVLRWKSAILAAAGNTGFDYLALLCALRAVGATPRPSLVVLAYASAELLAQVPFTPGGLGFVEAGRWAR